MRYRMEYLHSELDFWQCAGSFDSPQEALKYLQSEGFETFCDEIQLWDDSEIVSDDYPGPDEYNFDTRKWD